jgi:hypothetical protein
MIRWLAILCLMASCGAASARELALLKIRLDRYEDMYVPVCKPEPGLECIPYSTYQIYHVTLLRTYAGEVPHRSFSALLVSHSVYAGGLEMYVVAEPAMGENRLTYEDGRDLLAGQDYVRVWEWSWADQGFCLPADEEEEKYGIADAANALRRDHPCRDN